MNPLLTIVHASARPVGPMSWDKCYQAWIAARTEDWPIEYLLVVDQAQLDQFWERAQELKVHIVVNKGRACCVEAYNVGAAASCGDVLMLQSDDMFPPKGWDEMLRKAMPMKPRHEDFVVRCHVHPAFDKSLIYLQILSRGRYNRLGYALFPEFVSMYGDMEFTAHARHDGVIIEAPQIQVEHRHPHHAPKLYSMDDCYTKEQGRDRYEVGKAVFDRRVAQGFPDERKKITPVRIPRLYTQHPIAESSVDHLEPHGTADDNTHCPAFVTRCEELFGRKVSVLDIGCAGGGLVQDFIEQGHVAAGLDGSDFSKKRKRAAWGVVPDALFTCDVRFPFSFQNPSVFDVVTCWATLEHFAEDELTHLMMNVCSNLSRDGGMFCGLINTVEDPPWHKTVEGQLWWRRRLGEFFRLENPYWLFRESDFPRGSGNGPFDAKVSDKPGWGFHFVAFKDNQGVVL